MSLNVVATPIGPLEDITLRALQCLKEAELVIGEERKVTLQRLKHWGLLPKPIRLLNEHTEPDEVVELAELCRSQNVALISDCGTPGFCDPGADLVRLCREKGIDVHPLPGASSLLSLLSVSGRRLDRFLFYGFLSNKSEIRAQQLKELKTHKAPVILMDTPYRLTKLLEELAQQFPQRTICLGLDLTQETEAVLEGKATEILAQVRGQKREFILILD